MPYYPPPGGGGVTDHGALTGLTDDDHILYALDSDLTTHAGAADPHTGYQKESEKGQANGYASLGAGGLVPIAQLATGTPDGTKFIRDDGTLVAPSGGGVPTTIATVGGLQFFRQTADLTNATTTPQNCAGLVFTFVANGVYIIDLYLMATSAAATTGYGWAFDVSVAVNYVGCTWEHQLATTGTLSGGDQIADAASRGLSSGVPAVTVTNMVMGKGILRAGANGGTAQLQFRPEVAASATAKLDSVIRVQRVL